MWSAELERQRNDNGIETADRQQRQRESADCADAADYDSASGVGTATVPEACAARHDGLGEEVDRTARKPVMGALYHKEVALSGRNVK